MHLVDTHCHINMMVKKDFDRVLTEQELVAAGGIVEQAHTQNVRTIINVGTSLIESKNCVEIARRYKSCYATIGIHPNDATEQWMDDLKELQHLACRKQELNIVGIGECGIDKHYPEYNLRRQKDVFKAQIELALEHDLGLVIHTRDAGDETLTCLEEFAHESSLRGTIHCFSEDLDFAHQAIAMGFVLGLGGTITYPKNVELRDVAQRVKLDDIILETDAPFLPPQPMRGQPNHPRHIAYIAEYLADLRSVSVEEIALQTTINVQRIFGVPREGR
ncbi:TatD family hydrolase [Candidatus Dependentiae bacterium]|nr:TatD family hydrolase [Candidatus Dependentiae bacterium]